MRDLRTTPDMLDSLERELGPAQCPFEYQFVEEGKLPALLHDARRAHDLAAEVEGVA